jgi:hypothetical protein
MDLVVQMARDLALGFALDADAVLRRLSVLAQRADSEYWRRCSSPSTTMRRPMYWPGLKSSRAPPSSGAK